MMKLPVLNDVPLKRHVDKEVAGELSPMDPPEAYAAPTAPAIPYEKLAEPLQRLMEEHEWFLKVLTVFDNALIALKENRWRFTPEISAGLKQFFQAMDHDIARHTRLEEKYLFPSLEEKFLATGEHSPGSHPVTPIDVMEGDHARLSQDSALVFNLLGIGSRLTDAGSREIVFAQVFAQGQGIVEVMKLHIYKENTTLFPLAQQLLSTEEMVRIAQKMRSH